MSDQNVPETGDRLVPLTRARNDVEATLIRSALNSADIPFSERPRIAMFPLRLPVFDEVDFFVLREDRERALEILGQFARETPGTDGR